MNSKELEKNPRVKRITYYENGQVKEVEFFEQPTKREITIVPDRGTQPWQPPKPYKWEVPHDPLVKVYYL